MEENKQSVVETVSADLLKDIFSAAGLEDKQPPTQEPPKSEEKKEESVLPTPPVQQPVEVKTEEVVTPPITSDYSKKLKDLIKDGIIDNFTINYDVDGESQEVYLEDIEDLTEEGYKQIVDGWKNAQKEKVDSEYISIKGLDEQTKKLIELKKAGGSISEILKENVTAIDHLTQLKERIDDEQIQINIVAQSLQQQGVRPNVITAQIKDLIDNGLLDTEANTILDSHLNIHQQAIEQKRQAELQRIDKEKEDNRNLRKTLTNYYKEKGLPDNIYKVLVDNATKLDQDNISNTDKLYFEASKDPQKLAEINFFLNNPEEFKKFISSKKVLDTKLQNNKSLFTVNINRTNKPKVSANTLDEFVDDIIKSNNQK